MDGHAAVIGGVIVGSGRFDWEASGKYPELTQPDEFYPGVDIQKTLKRPHYY